MKANSTDTNRSCRSWFCIAIGLALFLLAISPQVTLAQTNTFPSSGNVGIGTTSPATNLHVESSSGPSIRLVSTGDNVAYQRTKGSTGDWYAGLFGSADYSIGDITNSNATYLTVKRTSGNVGIGTTDPSTPLSAGGWSNSGLTIGNGSASVGVVLHSSGSSPLSSLRFATGASGLYDQGFVLYNHNANFMSFGTNRGTRMTIDSSGNVGIGTTSPSQKLQVNAGAVYVTQSAGSDYLMFDHQGTNTWRTRITTDNTSSYIIGNDIGGTFSTKVLTLAQSGNVGIGTTSPTEKLHVAGNGKITGNLTVDGNIAAKYQDVAEWVPTSEQIGSGTVVVLDATKSNQVITSTQSYDTRVAGVISEQPGIALGESGAGKVLVATTGRVRVKVDASRGPIHIGDLLVTSDVPGLAMKSEPVNLSGIQLHRPGTLIGKALEPLEKGKGEILVLLSLQ